MSFSWINRTWHSKVVAAFVVLGILFAIEGGLVAYFWVRIDQRFYQLELAQQSRLMAQQSAMDLQNFIRGQKSILPSMTANVQETNDLFIQLKKGGEWKGQNITSPSTLQRLSLEKVEKAWREYQGSILLLTTQEVWKDSTVQANEPLLADTLATSTPTVLKVMNPSVAQARTMIDGQWLRLSSMIREFEKDVKDDLSQQRSYLNWLIFVIVLIDLVLLASYYWVFRSSFLPRLEKLKETVRHRHAWTETGTDELNALGQELNEIVTQVNHASDFVMLIGEGKLDETFGQQGDTSKLTLALNGMQAKLKTINEEDHKRRWANEGLTQFVDILRSGNDNIHLLGDRVISTLVQYTKSNQGGLYLVEEEGRQKVLELISLFAFNTKKFEQQKLKAGEGLVGQCYLEKETIFLTEIPEDYIRITSGLGGANPKSILIVPLKIDQEIYGIVELASFQVFQPHEIAFVEKLGETIASTLSSVRGNQKTKKLLEDFKQQAEQMHSQEEEMRQNMEELTATQEEMTRKEQDYILKIKELESKPAQVVKGDDWAVAEEMEKALRTHLEVLDTLRK